MEITHNSPFVLTTDLSASPRQTENLPIQAWSLAVKDVIDVAGFPTAAGNPTWLRTHDTPQSSASIVTRLLSAGANVVGKTITDELAYSLNGQNMHYPSLANSLSKIRYCGGSSSGSAVAVAKGMARIGLGTDTGGSIRVPASYNNLVGFRPTHGVIDTQGVVPLAAQFDTVGWMTQSVADAITVGEVVFNALPTAVLSKPIVLSNMVSLCDFHSHINAAFETIFDRRVMQDTSVTRDMLLQAADAFRILQGREIWKTHGAWITQHQPLFSNDIAARFKWASRLTKAQENKARQIQKNLVRAITLLLVDEQYLLFPTTPGPAPLLNSTPAELADYRNFLMAFTCIAGLTGMPQCHLPLFNHDDIACGISILGPKGSDLSLLRQAESIMERYNEK